MNGSEIQAPIIQTKFCAPRVGVDLVKRDRLLSLLDRSLDVPLTLVSAPAGYGKSILVSQWTEQQDHSTLWISLDSTDGRLMQFLSYLVDGLQREFPKALTATADLLHLPNQPRLDVVSACLLNDLNDLNRPVSIVLDDYHHLNQSSVVHELLEQLLQHFPPHVHLIMITRRDPSLPLTRLRALNYLVEIRLQDLRFNRTEIRQMLGTSNNFAPSENALAKLQEQIEGWAVGLRLVSLVLQHNQNAEGLLNSLQGGIPQIQEYLMQEVLAGLSAPTRESLMRASIFDRFCADLLEFINLDAEENSTLSGWNGADFIQQLVQANLFMINLDDRNYWFRFHHLFQKLLQLELQRSLPADRVEHMYLQASQWFESHGFVDAAIQHALKAGDPLFAARIIERHCYHELEADRWFVVKGWLDQVPQDVTHGRLILLLAHTWGMTFSQQIDKVAGLVELLNPLLNEQSGDDSLRGEVDFFRGWLLFWQGEFVESARLLQRAQARIASHKTMAKAEVDVYLAIVLYMNGQTESALQMIDDRVSKYGLVQYSRRIGALAFIHMLSGELARLNVNAKRIRAVDSTMKSPLTVVWSHYFSACVDLYQNRLEAAADRFAQVVARPHLIEPRAAIDSFAGLALARQMSGNPDAAARVVDRLMAFVRESDNPENLALVQSCDARISLLQGKSTLPVRGQPSPVTDPGVFDLFLWLDAPAITQIRLLATAGTGPDLAQAQKLLRRVRNISQASHFVGKLIEIEVLQSFILEQQGQGDEALKSLAKAIEMAKPDGWILPFLELGQPMAELLRRLGDKGRGGDFIRQILAAFDANTTGAPSTGLALRRATTAMLAGGDDYDLTNRELEILELLAQRMQNKEIANSLFISSHTVKDHLKHIYQKLGVSTRRQAVARALQSGIKPPA